MDTKESSRRPGPAKVIGAFLLVWLLVGFASGTLVLLGPVGWVTEALQQGGASQGAEDLAVYGVIALYVVASFFVARWLLGILVRNRRPRVRYGVAAALVLAAALAFWGWMNPGRMLASVAGSQTEQLALSGGPEFVFGAYPDGERLQELRDEGVTAVVSLQHPALPIETPGIAREREAAQRLGLEFIHAPMLPWVSDNTQALEVLRSVASRESGKFYVHCGLGRDRVNIARRVIASTGEPARMQGEGLQHASTFANREEPFERGRLIELEPGLWLVPYPNQHEYFGYFMAGQVQQVIAVLDPTDAQQARWLREQRALLEQVEVPLEEYPAHEPAAIAAAAQRARQLEGTVAVIVPRTPHEAGRTLEGTAAEVERAFQQTRVAHAGG